MTKYSIVVEGEVVVEGLGKDHAEGAAQGLRNAYAYTSRLEGKPSPEVKVVKHDPDDPTEGPAALKALLP